MTTLSRLQAPHQITDPAKFGKLCSRYQLDLPVTPVVVLADEGVAVHAVCGSHRIAALKEVYEEDTDLEDLEESGYILSLDFDAIYEEGDENMRGLLDKIHDPTGDYYAELCAALVKQCGGAVATALQDQI